MPGPATPGWSVDVAGFRDQRCAAWWDRFQSEGDSGLVERSRRPHRLAAQKVFADQEAIILGLRRERRLGVKQLRNEL